MSFDVHAILLEWYAITGLDVAVGAARDTGALPAIGKPPGRAPAARTGYVVDEESPARLTEYAARAALVLPDLCEASHVPELPRGLRLLMNTFGTGVLLWTAYCIYAWITHSGIWRIVMDVLRPMQNAVPDGRSVAFIAYGIGIGAMLAVAWPLSLMLRRRGQRRAVP